MRIGLVGLAGAVLACAGCLQIETRVRLNEDGSATVTERLLFTRQLLELGGRGGPLEDIASLLTKEAAAERMKAMGKDVRLERHEVRDAPGGARESIAVFHVPDFSDFRYVSPYLAAYNYPKHNVLKFTLIPVYTPEDCNRARVHPGHLKVVFTPETRENPKPLPKDYVPPKPPSPAELQVLRDLQPVFRDLLRDLQLKLTFETYAPLERYYGFRGSNTMPKSIDLIDFSDKNLDKYGFDFLSNEEIMLELLRLQFQSSNVMTNVSGAWQNLTLPLYHPQGHLPIYFNPSRQLFDRFFKGKVLDFGERYGGKQEADFNRVGHKETSGAKQ